VAVTAAGKVFQKYAEETIEQRRVMLIALAEMHRVPRGEIVVSANEGTCLHILPEVFAEFKRQYPDVAVNVKRSEHQKILEALIENSCDFGVVSMPIKDKRYTVVPIHRDELVVITPVKHPLAGRNEVSLADVAQFRLLLPKLGRTRDTLETLFHERHLKPIISMELDSSELTKRFVAADVGISFISRSNVAEELKAKTLAALKIADAVVQRDLALIFRKDKALSRAALAFIEIAVKLKTGGPAISAARTS
jgi:DNA-binding transcriptional LysR family regulator